MQITVDGADVAGEQVLVRPMNFGQPVVGLTPVPYEVELTLSKLLERFGAAHDQCVRELIADEPYDDGKDAVINDLRAAQWPALETLVRDHPALFERYAARTCRIELLYALFDAPAGQTRVTLNTLDRVSVRGDVITLAGVCYPQPDLSFLGYEPDFNAPELIAAYDEMPLWSATFGLLLLEHVPLAGVKRALDVGCGTGFPLIELAERLGPAAKVHGIDPWRAGLQRATAKIAAIGLPNVTLHEGSAASIPFADAHFDLIVSNLGINNFADPPAVVRECRRVARGGATLAITTNLQGHMQEFYDVFSKVLNEAERERLQAHIEHRGTVASVRALLEDGGFRVTRVVERQSSMRFAGGTALFHHHFIKLGFLDAWKKIAAGREEAVFAALLRELDARGELRLTIPMAYFEAVAG